MGTPTRLPRGFTMAEMLVVVALIAAVMGMATLGVRGLRGGQVLLQSERQLAAALRYARQQAIAQRTCVLFEIIDSTAAVASSARSIQAKPAESAARYTIRVFQRVRDSETGGPQLLLDPATLVDAPLPAGVTWRIDETQAPPAANWPEDWDGDLRPDTGRPPRRAVVFGPRGEVRSAKDLTHLGDEETAEYGEPAASEEASDKDAIPYALGLSDAVSNEETRVWIWRGTGHVRSR